MEHNDPDQVFPVEVPVTLFVGVPTALRWTISAAGQPAAAPLAALPLLALPAGGRRAGPGRLARSAIGRGITADGDSGYGTADKDSGW
jgi:hypothetical protein